MKKKKQTPTFRKRSSFPDFLRKLQVILLYDHHECASSIKNDMVFKIELLMSTLHLLFYTICKNDNVNECFFFSTKKNSKYFNSDLRLQVDRL